MKIFSKVRLLLTPAEEKTSILMIFLILLGMVFEALGIGLVIPVITLMIDVDGPSKFPFLSSWVNVHDSNSQKSLAIFSMIALVIVYLLKNLYLGYLIWRQSNFALDVQANLSRRLFSIYMQQPYAFHLQRNSAELVRNITSEVASFSGVITSLMQLLSESFVLIGVALLLLVVEPVGAVTIVVALGGTAWIFHRVTRVRISRWGIERQYHDGLRIQYLQQGLGGVKDIILLGRQKDFLNRFDVHNQNSARVWKFQNTLQGIPRLIFEMLAIIGLATLVIVMLNQGSTTTSLVPILGMFAASAFRLMPSVNRILGSIQSLRYNMSALDLLYEEIALKVLPHQLDTNKDHISFQRGIKFREVGYTYQSVTRPALHSITLEIQKGELIGFVGVSGSGKSTLLDIFLGLLPPSEGSIEVDGIEIQQNLRKWQDLIGYVPQTIYLTDDSLRRNVAFGLADDEIDDVSVMKAIVSAQLNQFVDLLPEGLDTKVGERGVRLSGGQRQRIGIARALYHDPSILVFDEATSALDIATEASVLEVITALRGAKTLILVAHRLSTVERCDRLFKFDQGRIVDSGAPKEVLGRLIQNVAA